MIPYRMVREWRFGLKTLWLHKTRSALTILGVVFGVSSVIAMLAVGEGASQEVLKRIQSLGSNNIIVASKKSADEDHKNRRMSMYGLYYEDVKRIRGTFPMVSKVVPAKLINKQSRNGARSLEVRVVATTSDWFNIVRQPLLSGRFFTQLDEERRSNVVVLTEKGARRLLAAKGTIGSTVIIGGNSFKVIGIIRHEGDANDAMLDRDNDAYLPMDVARIRFGDIHVKRTEGSQERELVEIHQLVVQCEEVGQIESLAKGLERLLLKAHPDGDFEMKVPLALLKQARATKQSFNIVLGSIAGISLLVGGIGIMNIMLASVTERTREIGVRRAIGARRGQIVQQFLIETLVLSLTGGVIGICLGFAIPAVISISTNMPTVVTPWSIILSIVISAAVGIGFGLYPAMKASKLDPIAALRHD